MTAGDVAEALPGAPSTRRRTAVDLVVVTGGRAVLLAAWFAATTLLARALGPASFGLYTLAVTVVRLATAVAGEPLDAAVMRSAPVLLRSDRPRAVAVVRAAFHLRAGLGVVGLIVTAAVPWAVSWAVFDTVDHRTLAVLAAAGVLGDLLLRSALGYFQVASAFGRFLAVDAVWQLGRAVAVVGLLAAGRLTATSAVAVYVAAPFVAFAVAVALMPRDLTTAVRSSREQLWGVARHARWLVAATAVAALYERLDLLMLRRFRGDEAVGLYGGAVFLASVPDFIDGFVQTVLAPRVAPAVAAGRFNALNRRYWSVAVPACLVAGAVAVGLGGWGVRTFLKAEYAGSVPAFRVLVVGTLFNLAVTPLSAALLTYAAPRAAAAVTAGGLAVVVVGGLAVIPAYGAVGAAAVIVAARVGVGVVTLVLAGRVGSRSVGPVV